MELIFLNGSHGVGKSYFGRKLAKEKNLQYINADFGNSKEFKYLRDKEMHQILFIKYNLKKIEETLKNNKNSIVDFGPFHIIPYLIYNKVEYLIPLILNKYEKLKQKYHFKEKHIILYNDLEIIKERIINRRRACFKAELKSLKKIVQLTKELPNIAPLENYEFIKN